MRKNSLPPSDKVKLDILILQTIQRTDKLSCGYRDGTHLRYLIDTLPIVAKTYHDDVIKKYAIVPGDLDNLYESDSKKFTCSGHITRGCKIWPPNTVIDENISRHDSPILKEQDAKDPISHGILCSSLILLFLLNLLGMIYLHFQLANM